MKNFGCNSERIESECLVCATSTPSVPQDATQKELKVRHEGRVRRCRRRRCNSERIESYCYVCPLAQKCIVSWCNSERIERNRGVVPRVFPFIRGMQLRKNWKLDPWPRHYHHAGKMQLRKNWKVTPPHEELDDRQHVMQLRKNWKKYIAEEKSLPQDGYLSRCNSERIESSSSPEV